MFIVVDGPNGSGKSTLIRELNRRYGYSTLFSPGATELSSLLRPICRGTDQWKDVDKIVQFLCFSAARFDEYIRIVHPKQDEVVIADRWWTSTVVYQCWLQGIPIEFLEYTLHPEEKIDLVVCLKGDADTFIERADSERAKNADHKRCSWTQNTRTQERLTELYLKLPEYLQSRHIETMEVNTAELDIDEVVDVVNQKILELQNLS